MTSLRAALKRSGHKIQIFSQAVEKSHKRQKFMEAQASFSASDIAIDFDSFAKLFPGDIREGEIPDPIPNSEVKPLIADGTAHKSVGE